MADSADQTLLERLGLQRQHGVGEAGWGWTILAGVISLIYFFPVLWIILTAFKTHNDALAVPPSFFFTPTLENFINVFSRAYSTGAAAQDTGFSLYFFNSIFIAGTSVLLALIIGTLAAFGFSRYPLKGNDTYLFIILTTRMLPAIVVIIPIFLMFRIVGLSGTYAGIILLYTAFNLPFTIWMMKSFFDELSPRRGGRRPPRRLHRQARLLQDLPAAGEGRPRRHRRVRPHPHLERVPLRAAADGRGDTHGARRHGPDHRRRHRRALGSAGRHRDAVPHPRHRRHLRCCRTTCCAA